MTIRTNRPLFRFAPSPNGLLHLGHAYSALYSWHMAKKHGGGFLLRIEDIDGTRARDEYIEQIYDDLCWLGIEWPDPVLKQSERFSAYESALTDLKTRGLVYPSSLSRAEIKKLGPGEDRDPDGAPLVTREDEPEMTEHSEAISWRLDMKKALAELRQTDSFTEYESGPNGEHGTQKLTPEIWGNVILARKDISTSYHLSVVVDDAWQQITHVTRGQDLFFATHIHVLLQKLLGLPTPAYFHHPLIDDGAGRKLSKSAKDKSLKTLREEGVTREQILTFFSLDI